MNNRKNSSTLTKPQLIVQAIKTLEEDQIQDISVLTMTHLIDLVLHLHIKETIMNILIVHQEPQLMVEDFVNLHLLTHLQVIIRNLGHTTQDILFHLIMDRGLHILPTMKEVRGTQILQAVTLKFN